VEHGQRDRSEAWEAQEAGVERIRNEHKKKQAGDNNKELGDLIASRSDKSLASASDRVAYITGQWHSTRVDFPQSAYHTPGTF
jgi:hypothetical protein